MDDYKNRMKEYIRDMIRNELAISGDSDIENQFQLGESLTPAEVKKERELFKKTGELPPRLQKVVDDYEKERKAFYKKMKKKFKNNVKGDVEDIVVPGLEWMSKLGESAKRDYKDEYKKFQSSTKAKKYRAELNKYNRKKGTYGNGDGKDASHKGGKIVGFEAQSKNRGRAEKSRLKKEDIGDKIIKQRMAMLRRFFDQNYGRVKKAVERDARTGSNEFRNTDNRGEKFKLTIVVNRLKELRNKLQKKDRGLADFFTKNIKVIEKTKDKMKEGVYEKNKGKTLYGKDLVNYFVKRFKYSTRDATAVANKLKDVGFKVPKVLPKYESVNEREMSIKDAYKDLVKDHGSKKALDMLADVLTGGALAAMDDKKVKAFKKKLLKKMMKESVNEVNMAHVYSKDLSKKKFKDLGLYLAHVLDLSPRYDFKLTSNKKLLAINIDKINPKSLQNIKKRFGIDLKKNAKEPIRLKSKSGMGKISHLGMESVNEEMYFDPKSDFKKYMDKVFKQSKIKVIKFDRMKQSFHNGAWGGFYTVKSDNKVDMPGQGKVKRGSAVLPVYISRVGEIELGVSAGGFHIGKVGSSQVVKNLKDFKKGDLTESINEISNSEAKELLKQLGGRRFMMMVGAKGIARDKDGLHMKIGRNSKSISHVVIDYNRGRDLYDMKFLRVRMSKGQMKVKVVKQVKGIYADMLHDTFEKHTGLYTRM